MEVTKEEVIRVDQGHGTDSERPKDIGRLVELSGLEGEHGPAQREIPNCTAESPADFLVLVLHILKINCHFLRKSI